MAWEKNEFSIVELLSGTTDAPKIPPAKLIRAQAVGLPKPADGRDDKMPGAAGKDG